MHSQPAVIALIGVFLLLDCVARRELTLLLLRSSASRFWRSEPFFAAALQAAAGPPIPQGIRPVQGALCSRGTGTARQSPLGGPAVPLSPGVSLSMGTGWETGLSPSPSEPPHMYYVRSTVGRSMKPGSGRGGSWNGHVQTGRWDCNCGYMRQ